MTIIDSFNR